MRARIRIFSVYSARAQTHMCTHARVSACTHVYMHVGPYTCDSQKCTCKAPLNFPNPIDGDLAILLKSQWRCIRDIPKQKCISPWDGIKPLRWFAFHTTVRQRYRRSKQSHTPEICNWGILEWKMWSKYNPTKRKCQWGITKKSIYGIYVTFLFFLIRTSIQIQEKTEEPQEAIDVALFTKAEITEVRIKSIQVFLRFYFKMKALSAYINGENNNHLYECLLQVWMFLGHPLIERVVSSDVGANKTLSI